MATAGTLEYLISIDSSKLNSGLSNADSKVKSFGDKMSAWAVAKGQILGRFIEKAGAATVRFVKNSVQESMAFDKSMSQVAATLGKSASEVQDLAKFARKMGAETAFTAQEAAEGLNYMALAGYDTQKSMKMLPTVLNLAAAGNIGLARASDMVTDAESALGLTTKQTETLIDQMAKASSKTNTSVEQLGDAILTVGGTAKILNGGTKELTMSLGVLADNGIKGSEGGTALRNTILALAAPTDKAAKAIKNLGVEVFDADGNMRSLPDIMSDMNDAMKGMTQQQRTEILNTIFNKRDLKAIEALLGTDKKRWKELADEIGNADGAAKEMAETQLDNLAGDVTKFKSALGESRLQITEKLTPALRNFVKAGTKIVQRLTNAFSRRGLSGAIKEAWSMLKTVTKNLVAHGKAKLADWLDLGEDASWSQIALGLVKKLKKGINDKKIKIAELLHIPDPQDASWSDIAGNITTRLTGALGKGGEFVKKLILGDDYNEESTWKEVGTKISGWITEGFAEDGWITKLLRNATEKMGAIIEFVGTFIQEFANWLNDPQNQQTIINLVTNLINAIANAAEPIINAIASVLTNPETQAALSRLGGTLVESILGKEAADWIWKNIFGVDRNKQNGSQGASGAQSSSDQTSEQKMRTNANKYGEWVAESLLGLAKQGEVKDVDRQAWQRSFDALFGSYGISGDAYDRLMRKYSIEALQSQFKDWSPDKNGDFAGTVAENLYKDIDAALREQWLQKQRENGGLLGEENEYGVTVTAEVAPFVAADAASDISGQIGTVPVSVQPVFDGSFGNIFGGAFKQAKGNWTVPYDNYPSLLHRGEMVLNKSQARQFRDGEGGGTDFSGAINSAVSAAMSKVYVMLNGDKVGDLTSRRIGKNINATTYNKLRAMGG